ncbi:MAG: polyamine ABC transporter permease [Euryarchaeota archaeon]|jgi:putative spermidine/putrescine transport system permease protein|nr:polyamine ABC transporter permease [Euryarchaeota archaeon]MDP7542369.1 ABC transporter permease [Acidimicrobiales bacterium]|tara:strand:- start:1266 stop:2150 length:885 start_codon:yes stop_codon:yes gene_type:complete
MSFPAYTTVPQKIWHYGLRVFCGLVFFYLIGPILAIIPLSFSSGTYFTYTEDMLRLSPSGFSLEHYRDALTNPEWTDSIWNSVRIAFPATAFAVSLGTLASIGLARKRLPGRRLLMATLISPMIVPLIISALGMFFFYSSLGNFLQDTLGFSKDTSEYIKIVLAHAVLGVPFVVITVTSTLIGFDASLTQASASMGAGPVRTFFKVQLPLILPGVISGALFAFITSFDEVVVVIIIGSQQVQTLPWQMFVGLREQISLTILAMATMLVGVASILLVFLELMRRRSERIRGLSRT